MTQPEAKKKPPTPEELEATNQEAYIRVLRRILFPSKVRPGHFPRWFTTRIKAAAKAGRIEWDKPWKPSDFDLLKAFWGRLKPSWFDHWGSTKIGDKPELFFVCEPYRLEKDDLDSIEQFAELLDLSYQTSAKSWHYPGRTFRVLFWPKKEPEHWVDD